MKKRTDLLYRKENSREAAVKELSFNEMHELRGGGTNNTIDPKDMD